MRTEIICRLFLLTSLFTAIGLSHDLLLGLKTVDFTMEDVREAEMANQINNAAWPHFQRHTQDQKSKNSNNLFDLSE